MSIEPTVSDDPMYRLLRDGRIDEFNRRKSEGQQPGLCGCDFSSMDLRGLEADGLDFSDAFFHQTDMRGVDLRQARLEGASIHGARIAGAYFPADFIRPAFLDNHDMNRFLYLAGGDVSSLKLAALILFTLPQPPIVYYGTEVGVTQERPIHQGERGLFEEARLPMLWGDAQDNGLRDYFKRLTAIRRSAPMLVYGDRKLLHLDQAAQTYAFSRTTGKQQLLVALNVSDRSQTIRLAITLPDTVVDRLGNQRIYLEDEQAILDLAPRTGVIVC